MVVPIGCVRLRCARPGPAWSRAGHHGMGVSGGGQRVVELGQDVAGLPGASDRLSGCGFRMA